MRDGEDAYGLIVGRGADLEEAVRERCLGERQALPEAIAPDDDEVRPTVAHHFPEGRLAFCEQLFRRCLAGVGHGFLYVIVEGGAAPEVGNAREGKVAVVEGTGELGVGAHPTSVVHSATEVVEVKLDDVAREVAQLGIVEKMVAAFVVIVDVMAFAEGEDLFAFVTLRVIGADVGGEKYVVHMGNVV